MNPSTQQVQIYQSEDGQLMLSVAFDRDTVWLSLDDMAQLYERDKLVISRHLRNVFTEGELERASVVAKNATTAADGKTYQVDHYNLDVVISIGYRVKSKRGVQFRQWATRTLKQHLVEGYTLNQSRLQAQGVEFEQVIQLLSNTLTNQQLLQPEGSAVLSVIADYARSWSLLQAYDEQSLAALPNKQQGMQALNLPDVLAAIGELKSTLIAKGEATELFGQVCGEGLASSIATIEQGFGDEWFYPHVASRAAHLLSKPVEQLINDNTLVALALLVAVLTDQPDDKKVRNYWTWLKNKLIAEGSQLVSATNQLKLTAADGKKYLTDVIYKTWADKTAKEYKQFKGLKKENLRDNMTNKELVMSMLAELSTKEISEALQPQMLDEYESVAKRGGGVGRFGAFSEYRMFECEKV